MYKIYLKLSKKGFRKKYPRKKVPQTLNLTLSLTYPYSYPWLLTGGFFPAGRREGGSWHPKRKLKWRHDIFLGFFSTFICLMLVIWGGSSKKIPPEKRPLDHKPNPIPNLTLTLSLTPYGGLFPDGGEEGGSWHPKKKPKLRLCYLSGIF